MMLVHLPMCHCLRDIILSSDAPCYFIHRNRNNAWDNEVHWSISEARFALIANNVVTVLFVSLNWFKVLCIRPISDISDVTLIMDIIRYPE